MFPAISEKQCRFEQADVSGAGGAVVKSLAGDGGFDLVHDCGLVDSVAMVTSVAVLLQFAQILELILCFVLQVRDTAVHDVAAVVVGCLKPSALFVCRSCNHSLDELQTIFARHLDLEFYDEEW